MTLPRHALALLLLPACGGDGVSGPAPPAGAMRFAAITTGYFHTCALTATGTPYCWGANEFGMLGDGTRTNRTAPVAITGVQFEGIDAGAAHTCGLGSGGGASCWGHNDEGQLGDGTFTTRDRPVAVSGGIVFTAVSAGHAHSCGLTADGSAYCWGDDSRGQLGDGAGGATRSTRPVRVLGERAFTRVVAGYYASCALGTDGA
ncbi:MAG TPA: hypothetical protein VK928_01830, partial [Longimicrobiales bacterium]|nr:hypothetical protein [Longimicrobiales bacterium]